MLYTVTFLTVSNMPTPMPPPNPENRRFSEPRAEQKPLKTANSGTRDPQPLSPVLSSMRQSLGQRPAEDWGGHQGRAGSCSSRSTSPFPENANVGLEGQMTQVHPRSWQNHGRVCQQMPHWGVKNCRSDNFL